MEQTSQFFVERGDPLSWGNRDASSFDVIRCWSRRQYPRTWHSNKTKFAGCWPESSRSPSGETNLSMQVAYSQFTAAQSTQTNLACH